MVTRPYEDVEDDGWPQSFTEKVPKESPSRSRQSEKRSSRGASREQEQMQESAAEQMPAYSENRNSLAATQAVAPRPPAHPGTKRRQEDLSYRFNAETSILDSSPRINPIQADRHNGLGLGSKESEMPTQTSIDNLHSYKRKPTIEQPMISFEMKQISNDKHEKLNQDKLNDFLLNDFAFSDNRNSIDQLTNEFALLSGRSNKVLQNPSVLKNEREEINLDELNALLEEEDGPKFEDKFSKMMDASPKMNLALPKK